MDATYSQRRQQAAARAEAAAAAAAGYGPEEEGDEGELLRAPNLPVRLGRDWDWDWDWVWVGGVWATH